MGLSALRVLLLNEFFYPDKQGGTATATANIAVALKQCEGVQVSVVTSTHAYRDPDLRYTKTENWDGIEIYRVGSPNWLRMSTLVRLIGNVLFALAVAFRALRLPRPDVVLVTTAPLTLPLAARCLKLFRGVPYAYLIYDLDPDRTVALGLQDAGSMPVRLLRGAQTKWLRGAARVIAIGRCMRELLIERYGLDPARVVVAEVGADPKVIQPGPRETEFRRTHNLEGFVALYSGNFGQYHDFDVILDAAERLDKKGDVTFVLVGGGHKKAQIETAIRERSLTNVLLLPFVPEEMLSDLLASANVHLVTLEEGMEGLCVPSKFYSCLASGRPVVAIVPQETEVAMTLEESQAGWHVMPKQVDALISALQEAQQQESNGVYPGAKAREIFDLHYGTPTIGRKIYEALKQSA